VLGRCSNHHPGNRHLKPVVPSEAGCPKSTSPSCSQIADCMGASFLDTAAYKQIDFGCVSVDPMTLPVETFRPTAISHNGIALHSTGQVLHPSPSDTTEGTRALVRYAFEPLRLNALVSFTVPANIRSRRVMEKIGMIYDPVEDFDHRVSLRVIRLGAMCYISCETPRALSRELKLRRPLVHSLEKAFAEMRAQVTFESTSLPPKGPNDISPELASKTVISRLEVRVPNRPASVLSAPTSLNNSSAILRGCR
jgi:hypothetical protein